MDEFYVCFTKLHSPSGKRFRNWHLSIFEQITCPKNNKGCALMGTKTSTTKDITQQPQLWTFVFHVCHPSYLCNIAIYYMSYWQLTLSQFHLQIQIHLDPSANNFCLFVRFFLSSFFSYICLKSFPSNTFDHVSMCKLHWLSQLVCVSIWSYTMLVLFNHDIIFYQIKLFMFRNVWTTYWPFADNL